MPAVRIKLTTTIPNGMHNRSALVPCRWNNVKSIYTEYCHLFVWHRSRTDFPSFEFSQLHRGAPFCLLMLSLLYFTLTVKLSNYRTVELQFASATPHSTLHVHHKVIKKRNRMSPTCFWVVSGWKKKHQDLIHIDKCKNKRGVRRIYRPQRSNTFLFGNSLFPC